MVRHLKEIKPLLNSGIVFKIGWMILNPFKFGALLGMEFKRKH
jgi:hypothetical protein